MCRGLSKDKLEKGIAVFCIKSYSKKYVIFAKCIAACAVILTLASCKDSTCDSMFHTSENAVNACRVYLSEIRSMEALPTNLLIEAINDWQVLKDSVLIFMAKDTANCIHSSNENSIQLLCDSLQTEFIRLANSTPKTFNDVLSIKEQISPYRQDAELLQNLAMTVPFFDSLDMIQPCQGTAENIESAYKTFLSDTFKSGIHSKEALLAFIKEEDRLFRSFLVHLPELADADLSAITHGTEKCCISVFQSADSGKLSYQDALIYLSRRTNRRIVLNALTCIEDINQGKVKTDTQARAYVWMLLQPYISLDGFGMTMLSDKEREALYDVAEQIPATMTKLNRIIGIDYNQWESLPGLLVKVILTSI